MSTYYDEDELDDNVSLNTGVFKRLLKVVKPYWPTMVLAIIAIIVIVAKPEIFIFTIFIAYMISGPLTYLLRLLRWRKKPKEEGGGTS